MTSKDSQPGDATELRRQAEKIVREKSRQMPDNLKALSPKETRQTLHELQVHQIELEMQNEELRRAQAELDASRARYFDLFDLAPVGYFTLSEQGLILEANLTGAGLLGVGRIALVKQPLTRFILPEDQDIYYRHRKQLLETGEPQVCELRMLRANAAPFWARLEASAVQDGESGEPVFRAVVSDIDDMKRVERAVRQSHDELRAIYDGAIDGILVADTETKRFVRASPAMCRMLGYSEEELLSMSVMEIHPPTAVRAILEQFEAMMEDRLMVAQGCPLLRKDGTEIYADIGCKLVVFNGRPCGIGFFHDITERKQAEVALKASLAEKEVLLKEIHHRVKNNMQVISSLVSLQAYQLKDPAMRAVLQDVTHRVRSMALVHEKLYQSANLAQVEFAEYAQSLLGYLWRAHGAAESGIRLALDLEPVPISINAAVPCGLILNELATNALKHAFRGRDDGTVNISLRGGPDGQVCLRVRDNGTGLPAGVDWRQADSLGLRLVQILAKQLDAVVEVCSGEGTEFSLCFGGPTA